MLCQIPYRIGSRVRVYPVRGGYDLPPGLPAGSQVIVRAFEPGIRVVEYQGRLYSVPMACVNSGFRVIRDPG